LARRRIFLSFLAAIEEPREGMQGASKTKNYCQRVETTFGLAIGKVHHLTDASPPSNFRIQPRAT
jgi:hypothetical protein